MKVNLYNSTRKKFIDGILGLGQEVYKIALVSSSYVLDVNHSVFSDISGELPTGSGYTSGG